jgi:AcrR family transcriptional regulator
MTRQSEDMPRPRGPSNPEATRRRILEAATTQFAEGGYHETSLAAVARDVGITTPSLLHYFPDKQALFAEVVREVWGRVADAVAPALETAGSVEVVLASVLDALISLEGGDGALFAQISAALLSGQGLAGAAVRDTFLPLCWAIEAGLRQAAGDRIHPDAPLFETILYIAVAHGALHRVRSLAPHEVALVIREEPRIALDLLRGVLSWRPQDEPPTTPQPSRSRRRRAPSLK